MRKIIYNKLIIKLKNVFINPYPSAIICMEDIRKIIRIKYQKFIVILPLINAWALSG